MESKKRPIKYAYRNKFLKKYTMKSRGDKAIYVREEFHQRLTRIVQVIGDGKIPLYAYLDNIIAFHFDLFKDDLQEEFDNNNKPLF